MNVHHGPAIIKVLQDSDSTKSSDVLATALGVEPVEIRASLHRMRMAGEVVREIDDFNRYTYRLPNKVAVVNQVVKVAKAEPVPAVFDTPRLVEPETTAEATATATATKPGPIKATHFDLIQKVLARHGPKRSRDIAALTGIGVNIVYSRVNYLVERKQLVIVDSARPYTYGLPLHVATDQIAMPFQQSIAKADIEADDQWRGERGLAGKFERAQALSPAVASAVQRAVAERERCRAELGIDIKDGFIGKAAIEADAIAKPRPPQAQQTIGYTFYGIDFAKRASPTPVAECSDLASQIENVIAKLHRPANAVLACLVTAAHSLRDASAELAKDLSTPNNGITP